MLKNNLKSLAEELIKDVHSLEGFSYEHIEEELAHNLATKLEANINTKDERIKALHNMFALGQIFSSSKEKN